MRRDPWKEIPDFKPKKKGTKGHTFAGTHICWAFAPLLLDYCNLLQMLVGQQVCKDNLLQENTSKINAVLHRIRIKKRRVWKCTANSTPNSRIWPSSDFSRVQTLHSFGWAFIRAFASIPLSTRVAWILTLEHKITKCCLSDDAANLNLLVFFQVVKPLVWVRLVVFQLLDQQIHRQEN